MIGGEMMLRLGAEKHRLRPGDYICFRAGEPLEHCLHNPNDLPYDFMLWGERKPDDVVVYPDSNIVHVRLMGETYSRVLKDE